MKSFKTSLNCELESTLPWVFDNSIKRFKHQIKMSGPISDVLNQNLWAKGM